MRSGNVASRAISIFYGALAFLSLDAQALLQGSSDQQHHRRPPLGFISWFPPTPAPTKPTKPSALRAQRVPASTPATIAVVGSGPISEADRAAIRGAKEVYRFNSMNNLRKGERVGTVFLRRGGWKGNVLSGLPPSSGACPLIKDADALLIIMDPGPAIAPWKIQELRSKWPKVEVIKESPNGMLTIDGTGRWPNPAGWSSGFVGAAYVHDHSPLAKQGHKVHIFGMNWKHTSVHSGGHPWLLEKKLLSESKSFVVHPTAASNYKPRNSTGKMMWMCEGGYSFALKSVSQGKFLVAAKNGSWVIPSNVLHGGEPSFGLESNDDGSFSVDVISPAGHNYLAADGHLCHDKAQAAKVDGIDFEDSDGSFELMVGKEKYKMVQKGA